MNEEADTLVEVWREKEKETVKWTERTQRLIFKWAGRRGKRKATIKMERRSEKAGTSTGSTASSEGGERRKR
jgi:plasmid rolling circle replication initiator protein Rep